MKRNRTVLKVTFYILLALSCSKENLSLKSGELMAWGDKGDGTYQNPVLNADYSDPDIIKDGNDYYMVCSDFHFMGMPVLKSKDLVNWTIVNQIYNSLPGYNELNKYGEGSWAPSIRYHNNTFYVYFCTPNEGLFMATASNPEGKWSDVKLIKSVKGWEDPCPFWDDDGTAYLGHSVLGGGSIVIHTLSEDGTQLTDGGQIVYTGPVAEGTKIYKRNSYYYLIIPEGGVSTGYEIALRSKNIYGPYERKVVLEQGSTKVNGPHQGAVVSGASSQDWFMHFRDVGALGRVSYLEPVSWKDDWPFIGIDYDGNGTGEPVDVYEKPYSLAANTIEPLQTSDEFNSDALQYQWQWNHNPVKGWSLSERKGYLTLYGLKAADNKHAYNTLTQKLIGVKSLVTTKVTLDSMSNGQRAGLCLFGEKIYEIGVEAIDNKRRLFYSHDGKVSYGNSIEQNFIYLSIDISLNPNNSLLQYSLDSLHYYQAGEGCIVSKTNYWKGVRPALFSYNTQNQGGTVYFDWFHYQYSRQ